MPLVTKHSFMMDNDAEAAILKLLAYCQANDWAGYDPYDALNSKTVEALPFLNFRLSRLVLTQALKRSPINIRRLMLIPKTQNPKAIALFLSALLKLSKISVADHEGLVRLMIDSLIALRSRGVPYWCWGYSFPWQTRTIVVPAGLLVIRPEYRMQMARGTTGRHRHNGGLTISTPDTTSVRCSPFANMPRQRSSNRASGAASSSIESTFFARMEQSGTFIIAIIRWTFIVWRKASSPSLR